MLEPQAPEEAQERPLTTEETLLAQAEILGQLRRSFVGTSLEEALIDDRFEGHKAHRGLKRTYSLAVTPGISYREIVFSAFLKRPSASKNEKGERIRLIIPGESSTIRPAIEHTRYTFYGDPIQPARTTTTARSGALALVNSIAAGK